MNLSPAQHRSLAEMSREFVEDRIRRWRVDDARTQLLLTGVSMPSVLKMSEADAIAAVDALYGRRDVP